MWHEIYIKSRNLEQIDFLWVRNWLITDQQIKSSVEMKAQLEVATVGNKDC